jgi:Icc-related predicted phosphoesterase
VVKFGLVQVVIFRLSLQLVVANDICPFGTLEEIKEFGNWLREQPCKHKIVVVGNHGPPSTILDKARGVSPGCHDLLEMVLHLHPRYHLVRPHHETYGMTRKNNITFINASICDGRFRPVNEPIVFDL